MRPHDAVDTLVEDLLGHPLAGFAAIGRDAHKRGHRRRERAGAHDLPAVEHVLQAVAERADIVGPVLHLKDDTVVGRAVDGLRDADLRRGKGHKARFALLQSPDHAIEAR